MSHCADSIRVMYPLFHAGEGGSIPTSALQLCVHDVSLTVAKQLNRLWHSRLPRASMPGARAVFAASFGGVYYAAAIWGRPIARILPQMEWLELQRLAIAPDAPRNTASRMLGVMAREVRRRFPEVTTLVSYQDTEVHTGTIYKAAGWVPTLRMARRSSLAWNSRQGRSIEQTTAIKQRWEKVIRPSRKASTPEDT